MVYIATLAVSTLALMAIFPMVIVGLCLIRQGAPLMPPPRRSDDFRDL